MKLTNAQVTAIATKIRKDIVEANNERKEEVEALVKEYCTKQNVIRKDLERFLETLPDDYNKLVSPAPTDRYTSQRFNGFLYGTQLRNLAREELGIETIVVPCIEDVKNLIVLETIEADNLETLIENVMAKV